MVQPTYTGFVETRDDAMILIMACLRGDLKLVHKRPSWKERPSLLHSGHIYIYEETATGIRRWMDGGLWTPTRVMREFVIYGERADRNRLYPERKDPSLRAQPHQGFEVVNDKGVSETISPGWEARLYGSLRRSFNIKSNGLIRKSISIKEDVNPRTPRLSVPIWHLVSYYRPVDVVQGRLRTPSMDESLTPQPWQFDRLAIPRLIRDNGRRPVSSLTLSLPPMRQYRNISDSQVTEPDSQPDTPAPPTEFRQSYDPHTGSLRWDPIPPPVPFGWHRYPVVPVRIQ